MQGADAWMVVACWWTKKTRDGAGGRSWVNGRTRRYGMVYSAGSGLTMGSSAGQRVNEGGGMHASGACLAAGIRKQLNVAVALPYCATNNRSRVQQSCRLSSNTRHYRSRRFALVNIAIHSSIRPDRSSILFSRTRLHVISCFAARASHVGPNLRDGPRGRQHQLHGSSMRPSSTRHLSSLRPASQSRATKHHHPLELSSHTTPPRTQHPTPP